MAFITRWVLVLQANVFVLNYFSNIFLGHHVLQTSCTLNAVNIYLMMHHMFLHSSQYLCQNKTEKGSSEIGKKRWQFFWRGRTRVFQLKKMGAASGFRKLPDCDPRYPPMPSSRNTLEKTPQKTKPKKESDAAAGRITVVEHSTWLWRRRERSCQVWGKNFWIFSLVFPK